MRTRKTIPDLDAAVLDSTGKLTAPWREYLKDLDRRSTTTAISITAPTNGQILIYNSTTGLWEPTTLLNIVSNTVTIADDVAITDNVDLVWNSINLTAGSWLVGGTCGVFRRGATTPTFTHMHADHGNGTTTIQTSPASGATTALHLTSNDPNGWIFPLGLKPYTLSGSATINSVVVANFSGGPAIVYGHLFGIKTGI